MTDTFRGLYRTVAGAYVTNGMMGFQVSEADYRAFGYAPDFDSLPWQAQRGQLIAPGRGMN
jgi:surface antigen